MKHLNKNEALCDFKFHKFVWRDVTLDVLEPISEEDVREIDLILSLFKDEYCDINYYAGMITAPHFPVGKAAEDIKSAFYIRVTKSLNMNSWEFEKLSNDVGRRLEETGLFKDWTISKGFNIHTGKMLNSHFLRKKLNDDPYLLWG